MILRMEQLGVPTYDELVFVARRKDLDEDGASRVRRFLQATAQRPRGAAPQDPTAGVDALLKADPGLDRGLQAGRGKATLPVFFPADAASPWGWQDPRDVGRATRAWMRAERADQAAQPTAARALTNEFLPGQGLDPGGRARRRRTVSSPRAAATRRYSPARPFHSP